MKKSHSSWQKLITALTFMGCFVFCVLISTVAFANNAQVDVGIFLKTPAPVVSLNSNGNTELVLSWNWDYISSGYEIPSATQYIAEISEDGINFVQTQTFTPGNFLATFNNVSPGSYVGRLTVITTTSQNDYVVGPVTLTSGGRRRDPPGGGGGGGDPTPSTNVIVSGLSYPGPSNTVVFTYNGGFEQTIVPDQDGHFSYTTSSLPSGTGTLSFRAQDQIGGLSVPVVVNVDIPDGITVTYTDINLPPTLNLSPMVAVVGETIIARGYAYKSGDVAINFQGPTSVAYTVEADADGFWTADIDTANLVAGSYDVFSVSTSLGGQVTSPDSNILTFVLTPTVFSPPVCGDNTIESPEQCDDGNTFDGDGCSSVCIIESANAQCGDLVVTSPEQCDDGNTANGDGCSSSCVIEAVAAICGDGVQTVPEQCDDGNTFDGDGCSSICVLESGTEQCGNGVIEGSEECDDGNTTNNDGCDNSCSIETTQTNNLCGNGVLDALEQCDDGNVGDGDGCSSSCQTESLLPESSINQPTPALFNTSDVTLEYSALSPNGQVLYVNIFISKDGGAYQQHPVSFDKGIISLPGLEEGSYELYSIAVDNVGAREIAPVLPDATFTIDFEPYLYIKAHPEKRLPSTGNWSVDGNLKIYKPGSTEVLYEFDVPVDDDGEGQYSAQTMSLDTYNYLYKGRSHLSKRIENQPYRQTDIDLDYTFDSTFDLLAGDVHNTKDDYVNGLDLSAMVIVLYNPDIDADLNRDGTVNGLDLSITVVNIYKSGEGL